MPDDADIGRHVGAAVQEAMGDTPVVYLQGARQTGKSTLAMRLGGRQQPIEYHTLDTPAVLSAATDDPAGFVAGMPSSAVIDEVQRAPDLALAIKAAVDVDRRPGRFLLTGSANMWTFPKLADSLAGRMEMHTLWPFSQGELAGVRETFIDRMFAPDLALPQAETLDQDDLLDRICTGGFPEVRARRGARRREAWFDAYTRAILDRDVRDIANVERLMDLPRLLSLLATRAAQLVNLADLARTLEVPQTTLKRYMTLLRATFLVWPLQAWSANLGKRLTKAPKVMLADTGLLTHLIDANAARLRDDRTLLGKALENFVAMELTKQLGWCERRCELFHFRTASGSEVDLVLEDRRGRVVGVEVKATASVRRRDFAGLDALASALGERFVRGAVIYTGAEVVPFGNRLHALPLAQLWA